jgi:glycosyltransferase involved in cell wall biosynthesis
MNTSMPGQQERSDFVEAVAGTRVMIWYEGRSDTFFRISDRIARWLGMGMPAADIALATTAGDQFVQAAEQRGNRVFRYCGPRGREAKLRVATHFWSNCRRFRALLDAFRPDVIILVANFAPAWPLVRDIRKRGIRLVYLMHDPQPHEGDYLPWWQDFSQRQLVKSADAVLTLSAAMLEKARALGFARGGRRLGFVPLHGIGFPLVEAPRALVQGRPLQFLFLGRLIAYKGLDLVADACRRLADRSDWRLTIAGDGPLAGTVRRDFGTMAQVNLDYLRHIEEAEVDALIAAADVMLCPYSDASQSGVVVEATLMALPCIVNPVGALAEQVDYGRAGYVMAETSGAALAEAMTAVLDDRQGLVDRSARLLAFWQETSSGNAWLRTVAAVLGKARLPGEAASGKDSADAA